MTPGIRPYARCQYPPPANTQDGRMSARKNSDSRAVRGYRVFTGDFYELRTIPGCGSVAALPPSAPQRPLKRTTGPRAPYALCVRWLVTGWEGSCSSNLLPRGQGIRSRSGLLINYFRTYAVVLCVSPLSVLRRPLRRDVAQKRSLVTPTKGLCPMPSYWYCVSVVCSIVASRRAAKEAEAFQHHFSH